MQQTFFVENIKCGGCMNTIRKGLEALEGVETAEPDNQNGKVDVTFDEQQVTADQITAALSGMGYPPSGANTLGRQAKSYVSCMIGRLN